MATLDKIVYRILSGYLRIHISYYDITKTYIIKGSTVTHKYLAEELYQNLFEEYSNDLMSDDQLYDWLLVNEFWSFEEEEKLGVLKKNLEEFQLKLYELGFKGREKNVTKKLIKHTKDEMKRLAEKRHSFDHLSAKGMATIEKNKFLIALGLCNKRGKPLFNEFNYLRHTFPLFDKIIIAHSQQSIGISEYREMARTEPWRQYWSARESVSSIFSVPASELTEEQLNLVSWTRLYDNIYQHPNCPPDEIIEDDDALDGFLIHDKKTRDKEKLDRGAESFTDNEKIKGAQEIYLPAQTKEMPNLFTEDAYDMNRVESYNDEKTKAIKRERDRYVEKHGEVSFAELPDIKREFQMAINAASFNAVK